MDQQETLDLKTMRSLLDLLYNKLNENLIPYVTNDGTERIEGHLQTSSQALTEVKSVISSQESHLHEMTGEFSKLRAEIQTRVWPQIKQEADSSSPDHAKENRISVPDQKLEGLQQKYIETKRNLGELEAKLQKAEMKERIYYAKIARLEQTITRNATIADEIIDSEVIRKTRVIRSRIQALVGRYCSSPPAYFPTNLESRSPELSLWDSEWVNKTRELQSNFGIGNVDIFYQYWVRAKMHLIIRRTIFNQRIFGVMDIWECALGQFENAISEAEQVTSDQVAEWRSLTLRYAKHLNVSNPHLAYHTAEQLIDFLKPNFVIIHDSGMHVAKVPRDLKRDLKELCESAYDLMLSLRQSPDIYRFGGPGEDAEFDEWGEDELEPQDIIGGTRENIQISKIWMTIFGALVKFPRTAAQGEYHVMEKAHVICQVPRSPSKSMDTMRVFEESSRSSSSGETEDEVVIR